MPVLPLHPQSGLEAQASFTKLRRAGRAPTCPDCPARRTALPATDSSRTRSTLASAGAEKKNVHNWIIWGDWILAEKLCNAHMGPAISADLTKMFHVKHFGKIDGPRKRTFAAGDGTKPGFGASERAR